METLSITFRKQPWRCVLDPVLMLCSPGLEGLYLTQQLGNVLELWVFRELFHILDDTPLYLNPLYNTVQYNTAPDNTVPDDTAQYNTAQYNNLSYVSPFYQNVSSGAHHSMAGPVSPVSPQAHTFSAVEPACSRDGPSGSDRNFGLRSPAIDLRSLHCWERIRRTTDLGGYQFYWIGDEVSQSRLPEWIQRGETTRDRLQRYETLAQALELQAPEFQAFTAPSLTPQLSQSKGEPVAGFHQPLFAACRDAAALAAALGSSFILTAQPHRHDPPFLVSCLHQWGIACQQLPATDAIATLEQKLFYQLFVEAGLSKLLWSKEIEFSIVHLSVPAAFGLGLSPQGKADEACDAAAGDRLWELENLSLSPLDTNPWEDAQVYWYALTPPSKLNVAHANTSSSLTC